jgi:UDP-glucose:(heptosyl)LPS alpha-1,3-glucosyltransferase
MRLALIRSRYNPFGGAERFIENAVTALAGQGAELTVVTRKWPERANTKIGKLIVDPFYIGSWWRDAGFARAVCAKLEGQRFDLVQSHERLACCDVYRAGDGVHAEWLAQRSRVTSTHKQLGVRLNPHHRFVLRAERDMFKSPRLKAVICNSRMVKDEIVRHFGTQSEKLRVIYNAVDGEKFNPALRDEHRDATRDAVGCPRQAPLFLFVGSGFERKGLYAFLKALSALPSDCRGVVVGSDKKLAVYREVATGLGLGGRLHFTGGVNDVRPYYAAADVFVLPTLYDPLPNAALEAMACGLPAVVSTKCGAAELIENGRQGYVRDALDVSGIADGMQGCLANLAPMGEAARAAVLPHTPERMAGEYLTLYRELLSAK